MEKEIFDGLMNVFNSVNFRYLTHVEVTRLLQRRGFYQNVETHKAMADVWDHLNCPTATYPFYGIEKNDEVLWGLERWLPPKKRRIVKRSSRAAPLLQVGWEIQHTISVTESEIADGTFPLRGQYADRFIASMDEKQRENSIVELHCYGSEKLICAVTHDDRGSWILEGRALQRWYKENGLRSGDKIWLSVENVNPLTLRAYTEWDRDFDTYRRYEQRRNIEALSSTDLPIRDIIWIYFKRTQKIAHRSEISKAVLKERPEISERSVDACLGANLHLFARVGDRGNWGLKEWDVEQVNIVIRSKGSDIETAINENLPTATVPLDYVLANIAAEDLVYKILRGLKDSLSVSQITEKIARYLGIDRSILARTTFFNPSDSRLIRLHDGSFTLRDNLEEVISELATRERELMESLEQVNEEVIRLKDEIASMTAQHETTWSKERTVISQVLSEFLAEIIADIGYPNLQLIFHRMRRKAKRPREEKQK